MLKSQKSLSKPARPPPPPPPAAQGRRGTTRQQTPPKDANAVVKQDPGETPEFLRIKLRSTSSISVNKPRQSYTTDDVDEIKRLSKEGKPTPPMRHKKYTGGGSNPPSGQSSPQVQRSKRRSYTTDDIGVVSGTSKQGSVEELKKDGSVKPKAPPKPWVHHFAKRTNRDRTPERDKNHRIVDEGDPKSPPRSKALKQKQKSEDSGTAARAEGTKQRSKSLTHVFNRKVNDDKHKTVRDKPQDSCDIKSVNTSCDSDNGAMDLDNETTPVATTNTYDFNVSVDHVYDDVYVGDVDDDETDDGTLTKKKSMRLLKEWGLDVKVPTDDDDEIVAEKAETLKRNRLDAVANDDAEDFSTHEYSSFEDESFDSDSDSDTSDLNNVSANTSAMQQVLQDMADESANMTPLHRKAHELLITERAYVKKLKLIDQTFQFKIDMENKKHNMFPDEVINQMFANIKSIFQLHDAHLLPKLEERMKNWDSVEKIGDILCTFAPFLKMYSEYVKNYDTGTTLLSNWYQKCPKFKALIDELQSLPECGHLALQHHMLEPIQRVPRYELLLKDYLKLLPEDSEDRADTEKALNVVTTAASHSNEAMKKIDKFRKVLDVHDKIGGSIPDLVSPTRELVKEGKVMKVSRRKGALLERHLFLFNDLLLVCCEQGINLIRPSYSVRDKLSIDGMKIFEGDNPDVKYTFRVKSREKVLEFSASGLEEKDEWQAKLWSVVQDLYKKKSSLKPDDRLYDTGMSEDKIGMEAPNWVRDNSASMCMVCSVEFKTFRRRHHCRACGVLVCNKCSEYRTKLQFDDKIHRVCKRCHDIIIAKGVVYSGGEGVEICPGGMSQKNKPRILQKKADDPSVMSGSLKVSTDGGKTWTKRWFAVHTDFVLYSFKAKRDVAATNSTPLPGYRVQDVDEADNIQVPCVFKLCHVHQTYFYQAPTEPAKIRWMDILSRVVKAEIPTIYQPNPTEPEDDDPSNDGAPAD